MNRRKSPITLSLILLMFCLFAFGCTPGGGNTNSTTSGAGNSSSPTTSSSPAASPVPYPTAPPVPPVHGGTQVVADWVRTAGLAERIGQRFTYTCPRYNGAPMHDVSGSDQYHTSSPICYAALHAGVITQEGGQVTFEIKPGLTSYATGTRNGVNSVRRNVDGYEPTNQLNWSFVFVR